MRNFIALAAFLMILVPSVAQAEPRCGDVDGGILDDVWDIADDIRFWRDYRDPIENVCDAMEALEEYQKNNTLSKAENKVLDDRAEMLEEKVERQLQDMHDDLRAVQIWLRADAENDRQRIRRYVNIKDARARVAQTAVAMEGSKQEALTLIKP